MKCVLFDFDYTLVDATEGIVESANYALATMGRSQRSVEEIRMTVGLTLEESFSALTDCSDPVMQANYRKHYLVRAMGVMPRMTVVLPHVRACLGNLRLCGVCVGIVSTKVRSSIIRTVREQGLDDAFKVIVGGDDVVEAKPHPEGILRAASALEVGLENVLYVGDSIVDVQAAQNAGVAFVGVLTGTTSREELRGPNTVRILSDLSQLNVERSGLA